MTKFCKDCKYFRDGYAADWCVHPSLGLDLVTGKVRNEFALALRRHTDKCVEDAKLFEPIAKSKTRVIIAGIKEFFKKG